MDLCGALPTQYSPLPNRRKTNAKTTNEKTCWDGSVHQSMRWIGFGPATRGAFQRSGRCRRSEASRTGNGESNGGRRFDKLNQIYADDWATVDSSGKIFTKESLLSDFKSGKHKLLSFEIGPMDVQVFGDVAVVQASVTEKRLHDGKDISGQFVFMDLLKKRGDKWVIVRTLGARVI